MQYGPKPIMSARQPRPAASFAAGSKRWTSSTARPGSQNAQRNYDRYLALARAEAQRRLLVVSVFRFESDE